ncbi:elongation factor 4 [Candidatus Saccharibacteria bacterium QS_5_54_17]|nr:MAG: elongation factor 4 [Candidatus Saccharibacteria bacterium QS_5_54_17]
MKHQADIRNFCIIAHIDHGKSTLADRMLELTDTVQKQKMQQQLLDQMDLERERGITIKLQPVSMYWHGYELNLIDTPGHVDFSYEVARSLAAAEGAILVADATQGIEAQTLANVYLAIEAELEIIPVVNKIDLPAAQPDAVAGELANLLGGSAEDVLRISAKTGEGVDQVLNGLITHVPAPTGHDDVPLRGLIFDSIYDEYRGVILYVRIVDGMLTSGSGVVLLGSGKHSEATEIGAFYPQPVAVDVLYTGQIGYVVTRYKSVRQAQVGDTLTTAAAPAAEALPGYKTVKPFVFAGFYPASGEQYQQLKDALERLQLNDAALQFSPENSKILGFGFRIGFLGLLHMEIIKERLEREYSLELVVTNPSTDYQVTYNSGHEEYVRSASQLPDSTTLTAIAEPWIKGEILVTQEYVGNVIGLINTIRGIQDSIQYPQEQTALITFKAPLANVLTDFYDRLKSTTSGYGSFSYEPAGYYPEDLVRLDILIEGEVVDSLSRIMHRSEAYEAGRDTIRRLKEVIPRQMYEISLQAAVGGKILARDDVKPLGKNVTAKLYGGDVTRKQKLLKKQKEGKKRMKRMGNVDIPPEAFTVMLKKDE